MSLSGAASEAPALAGVAAAALDPTGSIVSRGLAVRLTGHITCPARESFTIHLVVFQPATGVFARGKFPTASKVAGRPSPGHCQGRTQTWSLEATLTSTSRVHFTRGRAKACVEATTHAHLLYTDLKTWCREVTLSAG
jgi:hypothetical protein